MSTEHPITPSLEQVEQWNDDWIKAKVKHVEFGVYLATQAARWGADQELEACCEWLLCNLPGTYAGYAENLRYARRPKPPSLKEQALKAAYVELDPTGRHGALIIKALEALPE